MPKKKKLTITAVLTAFGSAATCRTYALFTGICVPPPQAKNGAEAL